MTIPSGGTSGGTFEIWALPARFFPRKIALLERFWTFKLGFCLK
jgi:hypothetical protein